MVQMRSLGVDQEIDPGVGLAGVLRVEVADYDVSTGLSKQPTVLVDWAEVAEGELSHCRPLPPPALLG